jgi:hypothetical protein
LREVVRAFIKRPFSIHSLLAGFILCAWTSCSLLETDPVTVPAYIYVPYANFLSINDGNEKQGDSIHNFQDVWIFEKGTLLGNIGYPALIPVQKSGPTELSFDAGIKNSGQDQERIPYPFTERQVFVRELTPNKVDTFIPTFKYLPNTAFPVMEGFESNGFQFTYYNNAPGDTIIRINDSRAFIPGKNSGMVMMGASSSKFELNSSEFSAQTLQPAPGSAVYVEMDYRANVPIYLGMYIQLPNGNVSVVPIFETLPTSKWNKVYANYGPDIANQTSSARTSRIKIYVVVLRRAGDPQPEVFLDNIKLVHFE